MSGKTFTSLYSGKRGNPPTLLSEMPKKQEGFRKTDCRRAASINILRGSIMGDGVMHVVADVGRVVSLPRESRGSAGGSS